MSSNNLPAYGVGQLEPAERYREGVPLTRSQTFDGYLRARNLIREEEEDLDFGKYLRGMVTGRWENADRERRAMSEGTDAVGGFLVPTILSGQIIDLVRNKTRVMEAGATLVPMESRKVDVARWEGDPPGLAQRERADLAD